MQAELTRLPQTRSLGAAVTVLAGGALLRRGRETAPLALAAGIVEYAVLQKAAQLDRQVRNAEDGGLLMANVGAAYPSLGKWAIEPDLARLIIEELDQQPRLIVELGSGASTLIIGHVLDEKNFGQLISIDHDAHFAAHTKERLASAGVENRVSLVVAPVGAQTFGDRAERWYDVNSVLAALPSESIDLLIVDGPPSVSRWARWPALEVLAPRLSDRAVVLLDDGRQPHETAVVRRWVRDHGDLELYWLDTVKGTWRLEKRLRDTESAGLRAFRALWRTVMPHPVGFGRWPVRR